LLFGRKFNFAGATVPEHVIKDDILEAFVLSDVVVVRDVLTKKDGAGGKDDQINRCEVRSQEVILLHFSWPGQLRDYLLGVLHELLKLARLFLVNDCDPALVISTRILWVDIGLHPADVAFNDGPLILYPSTLRVLVSLDTASPKRLDIFRQHLSLGFVGHERHRLGNVVTHLGAIISELSIFDRESFPSEAHLAGALAKFRSDSDKELRFAAFENTRNQDVKSLGYSLCRLEEFLTKSQVLSGHVSRKVGSDATLRRKVQLCEGSLVGEYLSFNFVSAIG